VPATAPAGRRRLPSRRSRGEKGDVDAAFAKAKAENKPVFLYWGAKWCPPCNQLKATLFNRQDFIERSRAFVPVYVDGDLPGAQKLGARFKVRGYPTMILFSPKGTEITRLPGEIDADQYMRVLALGLNGARPVKATLAAALASGRGTAATRLTPEDWRMLAYYSWDTDEQTLIPKKDVAATLRQLAQACPPEQTTTATRLKLKAMAAGATAPGAKSRDDKAARDDLRSARRSPIAREDFELGTGYAREITGHVTLPKSDERAALAAAWDDVLRQLAADPKLSATDRLSAVGARIDLAKLDAPDGKVPEALVADARTRRPRRPGNDRPYARETDQRRRARAGGGRPARRVRRAAHRRTRALEHALLRDARPRRQRPQARRQGRCRRLGGEGLRRGHRTGDAAAVGRELRQRAGRPDAGSRGAHREGRRAGDRRAGSRTRHLL
jgi:thiol-disulfide isomerase/thioredoxin